MALLKFPDNINKENLVLDSVMLSFTNYGPLYELLNKLYNNNASIDVNQLRDSVDNNNKEIVDLLLMKGDLEFTNFTVEETKNEIKQLLDQINIEWLKKRRQDIQVNIIEAEKRNDQDALKVLLENFQKIK